MLAGLDLFSFLQPAIFRSIDRWSERISLPHTSLRAETLIEIACRRTRLCDFGSFDIEEPLRVLTTAYECESNLSLFGRLAARWDVVRFLSNLLRLREKEKGTPAIADEAIDRPIFILGFPRSGTTFLHNVLGEDPANAVPRCWQTIYPYPERDDGSGSDRRVERVARQFSKFLWLAPELPSLHPLDARGAQECIEITGQVLRSLRFETTHYVPSYVSWLGAPRHLEAYRFHKRFLQHLQYQGSARRWILKSPDSIFAFDAIRAVYPDARFIFVHRDPMRVLASVARLTEVLRRPFTRFVDRLQIGRQVSDSWAKGAGLLIKADNALRMCPERVFHVDYANLVGNTLDTLSAIYRHFGIPLSPEAGVRFRRWLARRPRGGYGRNVYRLHDYGMDERTERDRYADYLAYFRLVGSGARPA